MIDNLGVHYICASCYTALVDGLTTVQTYALPASFGNVIGRIVLHASLDEEITNLGPCPLCGAVSLVKHGVSLHLYNAATVAPALDDYKAWAIKKLDDITEERIAAGFEYPPGSGHVYGLKLRGAINWLGLLLTASYQDYVNSPPSVDTVDGSYTLVMNSVSEVQNIVLYAMGVVKYHLDTGLEAQNAIRNTALNSADIDEIMEPFLT